MSEQRIVKVFGSVTDGKKSELIEVARAHLHCFMQNASYHPGGEGEQYVVAVVEYDDGKVEEIPLNLIQFC